MYKALVLSDLILTGRALSDQFAQPGWSSDVQTAILLMSKISHPENYNAILMVIDAEFRNRYSRVITEMRALYKNIAKRAPSYLLFNSCYDSSFDTWLSHTKRVFQHTSRFENQQKVVAEIIQLESGVVDVTAFMSPMHCF